MKKLPKARFVYFASTESGLIKIGRSADPVKRVKAQSSRFQKHGRFTLVHFLSTNNAVHLEKRLHLEFDEFLAEGEFFKISVDNDKIRYYLKREFEHCEPLDFDIKQARIACLGWMRSNRSAARMYEEKAAKLNDRFWEDVAWNHRVSALASFLKWVDLGIGGIVGRPIGRKPKKGNGR